MELTAWQNFPQIEDFWIPELLCYEASASQWQSEIHTASTLSIKFQENGDLLMKLEQKKRIKFDCMACLE